jgi:uncharacterized membrane protein
MDNLRNIFNDKTKTELVEVIKSAELNTSGEIRLHVDNKCKIDVLDQAAFIFKKLKMHKTELRNGVLIYLAVADKKFAIIGDAGINAKVPDNFWDDIKNQMSDCFKKGDFVKGLSIGIEMAGEQLKKHFPYQKDDVNELPDEISIGN